MNEELRSNRSPAEVLPLPKPVGFWRRLRMRVVGVQDRWRYRDLVADGQHTHLSRWVEASTNRGLSRVEAWERGRLAPIERELAGIRTSPAPAIMPTPAGERPTDARALVRWNQARREASIASTAAADAQTRFDEQQLRRQVLEAEHRSVRLEASSARERWVAGYHESVDVYARQRITKRGLRPAPTALMPVFDYLEPLRAPATGRSGARVPVDF